MSLSTSRTPRVEDADPSECEGDIGPHPTNNPGSDGWMPFAVLVPRGNSLDLDFRTNPFHDFLLDELYIEDVGDLNPPVLEDRTPCFHVTLFATICIELQARNGVINVKKLGATPALRCVGKTVWRASTYHVRPAVLLGNRGTMLIGQRQSCISMHATAEKSEVFVRALAADDRNNIPRQVLPDRLPGWSSNMDTEWQRLDEGVTYRYRSGPHLLRLDKDERRAVTKFCPEVESGSGLLLDEELAVRMDLQRTLILPVFPRQRGFV